MFVITLAFHGFLRMEELIALTKGDISVKDGRMEILLRSSKIDQFGHGQKTHLFESGRFACPLRG